MCGGFFIFIKFIIIVCQIIKEFFPNLINVPPDASIYQMFNENFMVVCDMGHRFVECDYYASYSLFFVIKFSILISAFILLYIF